MSNLLLVLRMDTHDDNMPVPGLPDTYTLDIETTSVEASPDAESSENM